jgi:hypothetical protein
MPRNSGSGTKYIGLLSEPIDFCKSGQCLPKAKITSGLRPSAIRHSLVENDASLGKLDRRNPRLSRTDSENWVTGKGNR